MAWRISLVVGALVVAAHCSSASADDLLDKKLKEICPSGRSEAFRQIPWHTNLVEAAREARETKRPLFVWVMDGHPLGCT